MTAKIRELSFDDLKTVAGGVTVQTATATRLPAPGGNLSVSRPVIATPSRPVSVNQSIAASLI